MKMEDQQKRLKRFIEGEPVEIIETLLNSISNFFNNEVNLGATQEMWYLVMLGTHAVALTISEALFGKRGLTGFKMFLEKFVDEDRNGFDYSTIAFDIHNWRNVIAHQWLSVSGYSFGLDLDMEIGWEKRGEIAYFNPRLYYGSFKKAFSGGEKIWDYKKILSDVELLETKDRLLRNILANKPVIF